jgi:hypothetical protein
MRLWWTTGGRRPAVDLPWIHPTSRSRFVGASDQLGDVEPTSKPTTLRDSPGARRIVRACEKATPALCPSFVDRPSSHRPTTLRALPNHQQERGYVAPLRSVSSLAALAAGAVLAADGPQRNDESVDLTQAEVKESHRWRLKLTRAPRISMTARCTGGLSRRSSGACRLSTTS